MKYIIMTCEGRQWMVDELLKSVPNALISFDTFIDSGINDTAYQNFLQALQMIAEGPAVLMEDDIELVDGFQDKIEAVIKDKPNDLIQFFSMRKKDLTEGSRYDYGRNFLMNQCVYYPKGMASELLEYAKEFNTIRQEKGSPNDTCVSYFLKDKKLKYWISIPNLVNHRVGKSAIDSRRSSKRQSLTFKNSI